MAGRATVAAPTDSVMGVPAVVAAAGITAAAAGAAAALATQAREGSTAAKAVAAAAGRRTSSTAQSRLACGRAGEQVATATSCSFGTEMRVCTYVIATPGYRPIHFF